MIQVGILWGDINHGFPFSIVLGAANGQEVSINPYRSEIDPADAASIIFNPYRVTICDGGSQNQKTQRAHYLVSRKSELFSAINARCMAFYEDIMIVAPESDIPVERWGDLVSERGVLIEFRATISQDIFKWLFDRSATAPGAPAEMKKLLIIPEENAGRQSVCLYVLTNERIVRIVSPSANFYDTQKMISESLLLLSGITANAEEASDMYSRLYNDSLDNNVENALYSPGDANGDDSQNLAGDSGLTANTTQDTGAAGGTQSQATSQAPSQAQSQSPFQASSQASFQTQPQTDLTSLTNPTDEQAQAGADKSTPEQAEGWAEGLAEGRAEGRAEGQAEGYASTNADEPAAEAQSNGTEQTQTVLQDQAATQQSVPGQVFGIAPDNEQAITSEQNQEYLPTQPQAQNPEQPPEQDPTQIPEQDPAQDPAQLPGQDSAQLPEQDPAQTENQTAETDIEVQDDTPAANAQTGADAGNIRYKTIDEVGGGRFPEFAPDVFCVVEGPKTSDFRRIRYTAPAEVRDKSELEQKILASDIYSYNRSIDYNDTIVFKNITSIYRLYKDGFMEYNYIPLTQPGEKGSLAASLENTLAYINNIEQQLLGSADLILSGIYENESDLTYKFTFDYIIDDYPVYFLYEQMQGDTVIEYNNAITVYANANRVVSCRWMFVDLFFATDTRKMQIYFDRIEVGQSLTRMAVTDIAVAYFIDMTGKSESYGESQGYAYYEWPVWAITSPGGSVQTVRLSEG